MSRTRVTGEDVPVPVPLGLTVLGFAAAFGAAEAWSSDAGAAAPPPPPPAPVVVVASAPPPAPAAPADAGPPVCPKFIVVFGWGAAWLTPGSTTSTEKIGTWLASHPDATAVIDGHADAAGGSDHANLDLSKRRASSVAQIFMKQGVAKNRLTVRGFGAFSPLEGESDEAARNRRVVVHIRGTNDCPLEREEITGP